MSGKIPKPSVNSGIARILNKTIFFAPPALPLPLYLSFYVDR
jgi:hypothetical protein